MSLIINADDFGISKDVNSAIVECFALKKIQRTTLLVNGNETDEAVKLSKSNGFFHDVGLHINIVEGVPITKEIRRTKLCKADGTFDEAYFKNSLHRFVIPIGIKKALITEIGAQMDRYLEFGFDLKHIDSHQHTHINLSVLFIVLKMASEHGFKTIRLARNIPITNGKLKPKSIYKTFVNYIIIRFNRRHSGSSVYYFGSYKDCKDIIYDYSASPTELMCHPCMINDHIREHYSKELLFERT